MTLIKRILTITFLIYYLFEEATTSKCVRNPLIVSLPQGVIKGSYDLHKSQIKFLGIPYASVNEKFQAPGQPPSWNGTLNADRGSIQCKQYHEQWKLVIGQEDCLVLNVFMPTYQSKKPLPVMVFIHGGGFYSGSNTEWLYNPKFLVKEEVIVVTINYRLGALGFLCLPLKEAPGNAGLKDQIAALKWVQINIAYFGGDPDSVTLFGQSAGGASINFLLYIHSSKEFFHRAIIHSGTILSPHAFSYTPVETASKIARRLGYNTSNPDELLKIYKNTAVDDIIEASTGDTTKNALASYAFAPCAETASIKPLITVNPKELLNNDRLNIPLIIGFNNKEGIQWASPFSPITLEKINQTIESIIPVNLDFKNKSNKSSFIDNVASVYFSNGSAKDNLIDYFTDSSIKYPLMTVCEGLSKQSKNNIYNYFYTYDSDRNINKLMSLLPKEPGASNGDELFCLFDPVMFHLMSPNSKDRIMITNMVKLWTSFAKTGEPSNSNIIWSPRGKHLTFIELGEEIKMTTLPNENLIDFWRETYNKYGYK